MTTGHPKIYVPSSVGRAALDELDRVPWETLAHAYGTGKVGPRLWEDPAATLRQLGETKPGAFEAFAGDGFFNNLCHQGTIFQATAFAVPFLAAFAAGTKLTRHQVDVFIAIFASVGIAASFQAKRGSQSGSWGPDVASLTREAIRASRDLLAAAARRNPGLKKVATTLAAMVRTDAPDAAAVERLERFVSELYERED
jgi:hypothetical protein